MLTNFDIEKIGNKLDLPIVGVYSKDELANIKRKIGSYYINMQNSDEGQGTHWVLAKIYTDEEPDTEDSEVDVKCLYFDSFGLGPAKEVSKFLSPFKPIYCNNRQIPSIRTTECGWYCLICDYYLEKGKEDTYLEDYGKFLNIWNDDTTKNLTLLKKLFKPL
jgi:hypothetical protein